MKKIIALLFVFIMCISLFACVGKSEAVKGKSEAVKATEEAIAAIGEVTIDSGATIATAEKYYNILTDAEKAEVENRMILVDAKEKYEKVKGEVVYTNAKEAYQKLKEVAELCVKGMDVIYSAWYFGIYEADDADMFDYQLSLELSGFSSSKIEAARKALGISEKVAKSNWQYSLWIVKEAIAMRGDYDTINASMAEAEKVLQSLTEEYDDYTYYPKLKDYYASVKSYVEFFTSPSGSFNQLANTINNYENSIRTLESDVGFLFNK
jgi:hypothetical protein